LLDEQGRTALADTQFDLLTQIDLAAFRRLAETVDNVGVSTPGGRP
jgi:hypothetical protein